MQTFEQKRLTRGIDRLLEFYGTNTAIALALSIRNSNVSNWRVKGSGVPLVHVAKLSSLTGIPAHQIRYDPYFKKTR